jgi:hypothetical protein
MIMNYGVLDFVGNLGVLILMVSYLLLQLNRLSNGLLYSTLNAAGAGLIVVSLLGNFNLSAFIIEVFWVLISFVGIFKSLRPGRSNHELTKGY